MANSFGGGAATPRCCLPLNRLSCRAGIITNSMQHRQVLPVDGKLLGAKLGDQRNCGLTGAHRREHHVRVLR